MDVEADLPPWEGSAVLSAKCLRDYQTGHGKALVLNSFHPDGGEKQRQQKDAVLEAVNAFRPLPSAFRVEVLSMAATEAAAAAKRLVRMDYPTIWLLDPYKPADLPWSVVESIASHRHEWRDASGKVRQRRPEMFISLMTHDLQRNVDQHPESMSTCLGQDPSVWKPALDDLLAAGLNKRDAALELYLRRLREHYSKEPFTMEIPSAHGNIVYVLIFCTDQDPGHHMMRREGLPAYRVWRERKWEKPAEQISATRRERRKAQDAGHKLGRLDDF